MSQIVNQEQGQRTKCRSRGQQAKKQSICGRTVGSQVSRDDVNKGKDRTEPKQLGGKGGVRAAAVDACNSGILIDEPIQSWIQGGGIEYGRDA